MRPLGRNIVDQQTLPRRSPRLATIVLESERFLKAPYHPQNTRRSLESAKHDVRVSVGIEHQQLESEIARTVGSGLGTRKYCLNLVALEGVRARIR